MTIKFPPVPAGLLARCKPWILSPLAGALGGGLAQLLGWPLPWMIGALLGVAALRCLGCLTLPMPHGIKVGQWIIATGIGLHFNPAVLEQILAHLGLVLVGTLLTVLTCVIGIVLHRRHGESFATAYFASMPGGASEMVNLGRPHGAELQHVAASHSLRMMLVLVGIPAIYTWLFAGGQAATITQPGPDAGWLALLFALGGLVALVFQRWRFPNAWQLGALLVSGLFSVAFDLHIGLPDGAGEVGQWLLGSSLGCHFERSFFRRAPAFMLRTLLATVAAVLLAVPIALLMSWGSGLDARTLVLGMVPGGIAEMSLTAEALGLVVPLVTAMQVLRLLLVLFLARPVFRFWSGRAMQEGGAG
ncbi:AbrB family transcriptional regulator [Azotobacter chroococcum]|uniref:AbrB family transcriptional regulator n=1 Tax=Azotobacter chroococcum TaxID=353 RepID=A0AAQ0BZ47_9GAMM|nr:AbrB family transcriptional regulator [Azotobacter chroococcum]